MNQMPVNKGYDNIEEYLAVVLTNIYSPARARMASPAITAAA
jgi:hypothetical protein